MLTMKFIYLGGPLVTSDELQVGIVSKSEDPCGVSPHVYTRVSSVVDWVEDTVCERTGELCRKGKVFSTPGPEPDFWVIFGSKSGLTQVRGPFGKAGKVRKM